MFHILDYQQAQANPDLLRSMYELRHEVFVKRLGWKLNCPEGLEIDQFDHEDAVYLVMTNDQGQAIACARLLPTLKPNLIMDVFPFLIDGGRLPISRTTWEITRFAVDHRRERLGSLAEGANPAAMLYCAIFEFAYRAGLEQMVSVSDRRMERIIRRFGGMMERTGRVYKMDGVEMVGELYDVTLEHLMRIRSKSNIKGSVLADTDAVSALAINGAVRDVA